MHLVRLWLSWAAPSPRNDANSAGCVTKEGIASLHAVTWKAS
jgi:hypothetical protein